MKTTALYWVETVHEVGLAIYYSKCSFSESIVRVGFWTTF
jgi:hypothetical protein